jgi:hypothetical protein
MSARLWGVVWEVLIGLGYADVFRRPDCTGPHLDRDPGRSARPQHAPAARTDPPDAIGVAQQAVGRPLGFDQRPIMPEHPTDPLRGHLEPGHRS